MLRFITNHPRKAVLALVVLVTAVGIYFWQSRAKSTATAATFVVRRGPLDITVLEGGQLQALESQDIKCEVRVGYQGTKILKIVEEGSIVTEEDVKKGKILVELDSSDIEKQILQQAIQYESAVSAFTEAQENYDIQLNQNVSDVRAAEQKLRFARMDLDKFLGEDVSAQIIAKYQLDQPENFMRAVTNAATAKAKPAATNHPPVKAGASSDILASAADSPMTMEHIEIPKAVIIDFSPYAKLDKLGIGDAKQKLRGLEDALQTAQKEAGQAKNTLAGTRRLFDKGFVTRLDLDRDEIADENAQLKVQTADSARDLFLRYEFVHSAEDFASKFTEAVRELSRAKKAADSKLSQTDARLKAAEGQYNVQLRQRKDLDEQLGKCSIPAKMAGLVVYGGDDERYGNDQQIREGAVVRERQTIITIPNLSKMSVNVKIHESYIKKVAKGQKARIMVDAFPDKILEGEVTKVAVLPDAQNRWLNPDLKVYVTTVAITGTQDWIKPGMSAKVEILVNRLTNVTYVPVQAVIAEDKKQLCYVANGFKSDKRTVETGQFNDEFIEIKNGLTEGEKVLLHPPDAGENESAEGKGAESKFKTDAKPETATPKPH